MSDDSQTVVNEGGDSSVESTDIVENTEPVEEGQELSGDSPAEGDLAQASTEQKEEIKQELKVMSKKLKLKVDGKEIEQIVDLNDEEGLKRLLQKGMAAERRMQEAAKQRREAESILNLLQNDPEEALRLLGRDPSKLAEDILERKLREMEMSPEEKARIEMEKKISEYEKKLQKIEQEKKMAEFRALEEKMAVDLNQQIITALDKNPELPKGAYTVKRIAAELGKYIAAGYDVTVDQILPKVKKQMLSETKQTFRDMSDEMLVQWLNESDAIERLKRIRKQRAKTQRVPETKLNEIVSVAKAKEKEAEKGGRKKKASRDFFRNL